MSSQHLLGTSGVFKGPSSFTLMTAAVIEPSAGRTSICQSWMHCSNQRPRMTEWKIRATQWGRFSGLEQEQLSLLCAEPGGVCFTVSLPFCNCKRRSCVCVLASHCTSCTSLIFSLIQLAFFRAQTRHLLIETWFSGENSGSHTIHHRVSSHFLWLTPYQCLHNVNSTGRKSKTTISLIVW